MIVPEHIDKSFSWLGLVTLGGILPLVVVSIYTFLMYGVPISHTKVLEEGMLLFFSATLVTSLAIDYRFSDHKITSHTVADFVFLAFPLLILLSCVGAFSYCFLVLGGKITTDMDTSKLTLVEMVSLAMSMIYAFFVKAWFFKMAKTAMP